MRRPAVFSVLFAFAVAAHGEDVRSVDIKDYAVTVYRAPQRSAGGFDLDELQGFALITETRHVRLPQGLSRLRFEGVAGGIVPQSALVSGFKDGVVEKNRDAALLSPAALIEATVGKQVILRRGNRNTGSVEEQEGRLISGADGGVVFKSETGIEALRCSGLPETFEFDPPQGLAARPTLSVLVNSAEPIEQDVTLSYLAEGFDWAATYRATLSQDERTLDLGAWVTLANGNDVVFSAAHTQVVAGRLNHDNDAVEPIDLGEPILAQCWPQGTTSDIPEPPPYQVATRAMPQVMMMAPIAMAKVAGNLEEVVVTGGRRVEQEQLGDLKLYRVPDRTTVASRQSKQVRLLDRERIPVHTVYTFDASEWTDTDSMPSSRVLRTKNDQVNHLGLPLPSGSVEVYSEHGATALLADESSLRDVAVDEEVELKLSPSDSVRVTFTPERQGIDSKAARLLPLLSGVSVRSVDEVGTFRAVVTNALPHTIDFELKFALPDNARIVRADHKFDKKDGKPIVRLTVPAHGEATMRFTAATVADEVVPSR